MIIVSQDKKRIVENLNLGIRRSGEYNRNYTIYNADIREDLGEYMTEERAKEVLQEIVKKYSGYLQLNGGPALIKGQMDIQPNIFNIPKIYEMPES